PSAGSAVDPAAGAEGIEAEKAFLSPAGSRVLGDEAVREPISLEKPLHEPGVSEPRVSRTAPETPAAPAPSPAAPSPGRLVPPAKTPAKVGGSPVDRP